MVGKMNIESKIDEKGRICIPAELRKILNLKTGEKMVFQIKNKKLIIRKATTPKEFIEKSKAFEKHLNEVTDESIPTEKLF